jgi:hypothetical protein
VKVKDQDTKGLVNLFDVDRKAKVVAGEAPPGLEGESFVPLLKDPKYAHREGRGIYHESHIPGRYLYIKGSGNEQALESAAPGDVRTYQGFGHAKPDRYLMQPFTGDLREVATGPRIRGAMTLAHALREYHLCDIFLSAYAKHHGFSIPENGGIRDFSEARARGLSVPISVVSAPEISKEINESLIHVIGDPSLSACDLKFQYGMAVLEVPALERLRPHKASPELTKTKHHREIFLSKEKMTMIGRVVKNQLVTGFTSQSLHYQNIYNAPHSECPQADHADLVPISDIIAEGKKIGVPKEDVVRAIVINQLRLIPFESLKSEPDLQYEAIIGIHRAMETVVPDMWGLSDCLMKGLEFLEAPHSVLSEIAERLIHSHGVETAEPAGWKALENKYRRSGFKSLSQTIARSTLDAGLSFEEKLAAAEARGGLRAIKSD